MTKNKEFDLSEEKILKLSQFLKALKEGDKVKIKFLFRGEQKMLIGMVDVIQKKTDALFIDIQETGKKHKNAENSPYKYVLCLYNFFKASLLITDGGVHPAPFIIEN